MAAAVADAPAPLPPTTIIVSEDTGHAYKGDKFRHVFAAVRAKAAETTPAFEIDLCYRAAT